MNQNNFIFVVDGEQFIATDGAITALLTAEDLPTTTGPTTEKTSDDDNTKTIIIVVVVVVVVVLLVLIAAGCYVSTVRCRDNISLPHNARFQSSRNIIVPVIICDIFFSFAQNRDCGCSLEGCH